MSQVPHSAQRLSYHRTSDDTPLARRAVLRQPSRTGSDHNRPSTRSQGSSCRRKHRTTCVIPPHCRWLTMSLREALVGPLAALAAHPRFIVYHLVWDTARGKWDKVPCDFNGKAADAHAIQHTWENALAASERLGDKFGVGYVFTAADGFFFLDIDNCLVEGKWSDVAMRLLGLLPGAAVEVSVSGKGLHVFGRGSIPQHSCKNIPLGLELYHESRFVALTGTGAVGSATTDCTGGPCGSGQRFSPPSSTVEFAWTDLKIPVEQDGPLLERMQRTSSAAGMFGGKATFADLWNANATVLAKSYPDSGDRLYNAQQRRYGPVPAPGILDEKRLRAHVASRLE